MFEGLRSRWGAIESRLGRIERRELREIRAWLENRRNLIHLSALLFVPLLIAAVTALSNAVSVLPFLLFPPLASGTYTLFTEPESKYASPRRFVGGLTLGAVCGWVAFELAARYWYHGPIDAFRVNAGAAAFAIFLTGALTWALDLEESQAFSTALLVLVAEPIDATVIGTVPGQTGAAFAYVLSVFISTTLVAAAFVGWRRWFYERRARLLYASTTDDDAVLVPMRGENPKATAMLGARLAAAHDAGKVVLLNHVDDAAAAIAADREEAPSPGAAATTGTDQPGETSADRRPDDGGPGGDPTDVEELAEERVGTDAAEPLEAVADRIESATDVPCQVVVVAGDADDPTVAVEAARAAECDLIVTPYESREERDRPTGFVRDLLHSGVDVVVHRSADGRERWRRVLVPVRRDGDVAHAMVDFATRLAGAEGTVSVCHCLAERPNRDRRRAEEMLAHLVEPFDGHSDGDDAEFGIETRVATVTPEAFVAQQAPRYDLVLVGSSTDRSSVSRFVSTPTADRLDDLECDLAIVATARG